VKMMVFPGILIVAFIIFFIWQKNTKKTPNESEMTMAVH
jgi:preprotein translocase subunit YajC